MAVILSSDNTWKCLGYPPRAPLSSTYRSVYNEIEMAPLALNMTSNNTPVPYVASASSCWDSTYYPWKAFNGTNTDLTDCWATAYGQTTGWLQIDLGTPQLVACYAVTGRNDTTGGTMPSCAPRDWTFLGSNDGSNWVVLDAQTGISNWKPNETRWFAIANPSSYRYYRLNITANNGHTIIVAVGELTLYIIGDIWPNVIIKDGALQLRVSPGTGSCISQTISLSGTQAIGYPTFKWDGDTDGVMFEVDVSTDGGSTWLGWQAVNMGDPLPGIAPNVNLDNVCYRWRCTLTSDSEYSPVIRAVYIDNVAYWNDIAYNDASWSTAYDNGSYNTSPFSSLISAWPDANARWIWDRASISSAPAGYVYFRKKFTLPSDTTVTIGGACDDIAEVYIDGKFVCGEADSMFSGTIDLPAGEHVIAVKAQNTSASPAGLILTVRTPETGLTSAIGVANRSEKVLQGRSIAPRYGTRTPAIVLAHTSIYSNALRNPVTSYGYTTDYTNAIRRERNLITDIIIFGPHGGSSSGISVGVSEDLVLRKKPFPWKPPMHVRWKQKAQQEQIDVTTGEDGSGD